MHEADVLDEYSKRVLAISSELETVSFYIDFSDTRYTEIFNKDYLYKLYCKEGSKYLRDNGIKCKELGPVEKGGGGSESLLDILKALWHYKDILVFFFSMLSWIKLILLKIIEQKTDNLSPRISIGLVISCDKKHLEIEKEHLELIFIPKLANLLSVGISLCDYLRSKHSYLHCDLSISGCLRFKNFSSRFFIPDESQKSNVHSRYLNIIKNLALRRNISSVYEPTSWFAIQRCDSKLEFMEGSGSASGPISNKYFLLFSSRILSDYFLGNSSVR